MEQEPQQEIEWDKLSDEERLAQMSLMMFDSVEDALASLPPEEQEKYRKSSQSITDARRSAERNEGEQFRY